jgi:phosphate transport system substrate-binding protein
MPSSQAIVNEVSQNPHAVGYVGLGYKSPDLKAVPLAKEAGSPYIEANIKNVLSNLYPISRPLYLYTDGRATGVIEQFIEYVISPHGQEAVVELDFVPVGPQ